MKPLGKCCKICDLFHLRPVFFSYKMVGDRIHNSLCSAEILCHFGYNFRRTDDLKSVFLQVNYIVCHVYFADRIDDIMLISEVISPSFFTLTANLKEHKPECHIQADCVCHDHAALCKNLVFWKENIDIILSASGVSAVIYVSIFFYTDQIFRDSCGIKHHDPRTVCGLFSLHALVVGTDYSVVTWSVRTLFGYRTMF